MEKQDNDSQRFYAVENLMMARRMLRELIAEMPVTRQKIQALLETNKAKAKMRHAELLEQYKKLNEALTVCHLSLLEMELSEEALFSQRLAASVKQFPIMSTDYSKLVSVLNAFVEKLPDEHKTVNASVIGRLMNTVKMGYYPTDEAHVRHMIRGIAFPNGVTTNLLDPCCGCGLALRQLAVGNNCYTYGIELDESRAEEAQKRLHRVGIGSYFYSRVSHEAFHLMLLNPPYLAALGENGSKIRHEKRFLVDAQQHLMIGGLLIYIIPYYRLTPDIARVLCDNFANITIYKFIGKEFERFRQIVIFGTRQKRMNGASDVEALCAGVSSAERIPELCELPDGAYELPADAKDVPLFKGEKFNVLELARQLKASKSFTAIVKKSALDSGDKRPPLPLSIGQIGLIGGSGMINGLARCDTPHIIKGRVVKETLTDSTENYSANGRHVSTTYTETVVNKMIFNILTPDGFKSLT